MEQNTKTRPVLDRPTSETHWTCPQSEGGQLTHHMTFPSNRCRYCHRTATELRAEQAAILAGGK